MNISHFNTAPARLAEPVQSPGTQPPPPIAGAGYYGIGRARRNAWLQLCRAIEQWSSDSAAGLAASDTAGTQRAEEIGALLGALAAIEPYWRFPGPRRLSQLSREFARREFDRCRRHAERIAAMLACSDDLAARAVPRFSVVVVAAGEDVEEDALRSGLLDRRRAGDRFRYDIIVAPSLHDAWNAVLIDDDVQAVVVRRHAAVASQQSIRACLRHPWLDPRNWGWSGSFDNGIDLARQLATIRPELPVFLASPTPASDLAAEMPANCRRIVALPYDIAELHAHLLHAVNERYEAPFFEALRHYRSHPVDGFHALPLSRAQSLRASSWMADAHHFFGADWLQAETSAVHGGLDSLLEPSGALKYAQRAAARAFGAQRSFFVTQGTSTANKIVIQALLRPGDTVLVDRATHKSVHYGVMLAGAHVAYLDGYALDRHGMQGAVPLRTIKRALLAQRDAGQLNRVRALVLTNCTFDGIVYDPARIMQECLAIKPDLVFIWDEAWFAFARFDPLYRRRTAMAAASELARRYASAEFRETYAAFREPNAAAGDAAWLDDGLLPDPQRVQVRVYATQSTHKTLSALRQGSMIHVHDAAFDDDAARAFHEAYMTHTSTSPNHPILASLDVARRQVELEGCARVRQQVDLALELRQAIEASAVLAGIFRPLEPCDLIPQSLRPSGIERFADARIDALRWERSWANDEFAIDPSRITLELSLPRTSGYRFASHDLAHHGIQVNKATSNTVLLIVHLGSSQSSIAALLSTLRKIATDLRQGWTGPTSRHRPGALNPPPLPATALFHSGFRAGTGAGCDEGDLRAAAYLARAEANCEYIDLRDATASRQSTRRRDLVSAAFVVPYPPGFPLLVPGQCITADMLRYLRDIDVGEIHGLDPVRGLRVFRADALRALTHPRSTRTDIVRVIPTSSPRQPNRAAAAMPTIGAELSRLGMHTRELP